MVSEKKREMLKDAIARIEKYPVVGLVDMHSLPAKQLFLIKQKLRGKAVIRMAKKRVMILALEQSPKPGIKGLSALIGKQPALLFSESNPFELAQTLAESASRALAKAGDIAPDDIIVPAGPTNLPPGPAIGELQRVRIQASVEGDKIVVKKETRVAKKGDTVSKELAEALAKLGIEPMSISLNLIAVWNDGMIFGRDLLMIPPAHYVGQLQSAYSNAMSLALSIGHISPETVPALLSKAYRQAMALSMEAGIVTKETVPALLAKAHAQAAALGALVKEAPKEG